MANLIHLEFIVLSKRLFLEELNLMEHFVKGHLGFLEFFKIQPFLVHLYNKDRVTLYLYVVQEKCHFAFNCDARNLQIAVLCTLRDRITQGTVADDDRQIDTNDERSFLPCRLQQKSPILIPDLAVRFITVASQSGAAALHKQTRSEPSGES